ncbi:hypothetical protein MPSI1_002080 [Malassezia psittaci]|uniref:Uncharacterized protein n=1 Tax=Malassezia psittaci TaxID=1821823 RepID=A0AAF0FAM4_9BASI|nr:hypothetical protein MPSI1_002080 [Malassezia psittaci]
MAERSALSRSSLYAGIFGDETESRGSVSRPKDSVKSVESDTLSEKTSTSAVPPMKPSIKHASTHKPTSPWSTALRFAPRPKQKPNIPEKTIDRVNRAVPQASVDQVLHRDGGISVAANDEKKFVNDGVKQIAAPPMDIPQDQVKKDKARARREVELFQCVAEQRDDLNPAVHTRKVL